VAIEIAVKENSDIGLKTSPSKLPKKVNRV
jgi:hypothetical protein